MTGGGVSGARPSSSPRYRISSPLACGRASRCPWCPMMQTVRAYIRCAAADDSIGRLISIAPAPGVANIVSPLQTFECSHRSRAHHRAPYVISSRAHRGGSNQSIALLLDPPIRSFGSGPFFFPFKVGSLGWIWNLEKEFFLLVCCEWRFLFWRSKLPWSGWRMRSRQTESMKCIGILYRSSFTVHHNSVKVYSPWIIINLVITSDLTFVPTPIWEVNFIKRFKVALS